MFRNKRLVATLGVTASLIAAGACTAYDSLSSNDQAITGMVDMYGIDAGSGESTTTTTTTTTTTLDDVEYGADLAEEIIPGPAPSIPEESTAELTEEQEVALWGEPTLGDSRMPCYPEGSCDDVLFADKAPDAPVNDATCAGKPATISAHFDNRQSAHHIGGTQHISGLTGNLFASTTEECKDWKACEGRPSHGSTHDVAVKAWCVKNEFWDPKDNPSKCLPKIEALPAKEYKWGDAGVHKHRWELERQTCAWLRGDPDMGAKYCNVMPKSSVDWKPEHTISLRVNGVPRDIVNSWNVGLGGAHAATHAGGGVQIGTFMGYGPAGFFAHVAESPANTWYMAKVENAVVACDDNGNVVETRDRSKSMDPVETK